MRKINDFELLQQQGFVGFKKVSELMASRCAEVCAQPGVYVVLRTNTDYPIFLEKGTGGSFKGKNPNVSIDELSRNWVEDTQVVYIGMTRDTLKTRLHTYMRFGQEEPVGHWGGRYIWQLADSSDLLVCWKPLANEDPRTVESEMIEQFKREHAGCRPFANLQG